MKGAGIGICGGAGNYGSGGGGSESVGGIHCSSWNYEASLSVACHKNQLTGTIQSTLGLLTQLSGFILCGNHLTGTIPSTFGLLTNLKGLAL